MPEVIDLCESCDEGGCEQDLEHCDEDEDGWEQDFCDEIYEHNVRNQFLLSDDNDEKELQTNNVANELQTNDNEEASIAAKELQVIDLSRSLHDVAPWAAKLPFDVEFDGH